MTLTLEIARDRLRHLDVCEQKDRRQEDYEQRSRNDVARSDDDQHQQKKYGERRHPARKLKTTPSMSRTMFRKRHAHSIGLPASGPAGVTSKERCDLHLRFP
jgi:hypothetical protein